MARPSSRYPTELELEILKIIWRAGKPQPVTAVRDALVPFRDLAITSVTTVMNIMVRKGYLRKDKARSSFVYAPRISQASTSRKMLKDVVKRVFEGSAAAVVANLIQTGDLDEQELARIRELLERNKGD